MDSTLKAVVPFAAGLAACGAWAQSASSPATPSAANPGSPCAAPWPGARSVAANGLALSWRAVPEPVATGRHFSVDVALCADARGAMPTLLRVDATMPDHRHGMNYRPTLAATGPGRYRAEGLLLHMPGRWEFAFELHAPGAANDVAPARLTQSLTLR